VRTSKVAQNQQPLALDRGLPILSIIAFHQIALA